MNYLFFAGGGLVIWVMIISYDSLIRPRTYRVVLLISSTMFAIGIACHFTLMARNSACGALLAPVVSLAFFRFCRKVFVNRVGREPESTYLNWDPRLVPDRLFNVGFFLVVFLFLMLATVGMEKLARAGW